MNTRLIAFSLTTAVGICLATSQLTADEPSTQTCVFCGDAGCAEEVAEALPTQPVDGLAGTEECNFCKEAGCFDVPVDETVASKGDSNDLGGELDAFVCLYETCESERIAVAEATDANDVEAVDANAEDGVPTSKEAVVEIAAGPSEGDVVSFTNEGVVDDFECVEGFDGWIVERDVTANDVIEELATVTETVEAHDIEDKVVSTIEEANTGSDKTIDAEASVVFAKDDGLTVEPTEVDGSNEQSDAVQAVTEESIKEEAIIVKNTVKSIESEGTERDIEALEPAIEEVTLEHAIDNVETDEATEARVSEGVVTDEGLEAASESIEEATIVEEVVEVAEGEDNLEVVEAAVEEAIGDDLTEDNVVVEEVADAEASSAIATDEVLTIEPLEVEDGSGEFCEAELAIEESIDEVTVVEETAEAIEVAEVEAIESAIEEVTPDDAIDNVETDEAANTKVSEDVVTDEGLEAAVESIEESSVEAAEVEVATAEVIEETPSEETALTTDEIASPAAGEASEEEVVEQEAVEDVQDAIVEPSIIGDDITAEQDFDDIAIEAHEDLTTDGLVGDELTLEAVESPVDEAELQEPVSESVPTTDVNEGEVGTVRTFEFGDCRITITSERQVDDFELLDMLWETVYQLEAEMD